MKIEKNVSVFLVSHARKISFELPLPSHYSEAAE